MSSCEARLLFGSALTHTHHFTALTSSRNESCVGL